MTVYQGARLPAARVRSVNIPNRGSAATRQASPQAVANRSRPARRAVPADPAAQRRTLLAEVASGRRMPPGLGRIQARGAATGLVLMAIAAVLLVGLVYLTQTLQAGQHRYRIDALRDERALLTRELQSQQGIVARYGAEPQVIQWAQDQGLDRLGNKLRISAR